MRLGVALALAAAAATATAQRPGALDRVPDDTRIECSEQGESSERTCSADVSTYVGWRVFDEYCAACHASDALGSDFAPSLVQRIRRLDRQAFYLALDDGYFGRNSNLGPWGRNPDVARYYDELWSYLSARASGAVPPGPLRPLQR
jgi:mono/diheme cytochrome c family protein